MKNSAKYIFIVEADNIFTQKRYFSNKDLTEDDYAYIKLGEISVINLENYEILLGESNSAQLPLWIGADNDTKIKYIIIKHQDDEDFNFTDYYITNKISEKDIEANDNEKITIINIETLEELQGKKYWKKLNESW